MKFRFDFVTNSSSSSYVVTVGLTLKSGEKLSYTKQAPQDDDGDFGRIELKPMNLRAAANADSLASMLSLLAHAASFDESWLEPEQLEEVEFVQRPEDTEDGYYGLDTSPAFLLEAQKKIHSLDDVQNVYSEESYRIEGERLVDSDAPQIYANAHGTPLSGSTLDMTVRTEIDRKSGRVSYLVDDISVSHL